MTDQNRKTLRSFYCRDYLWELFEQMTQELGCSMDYLINESMRLYARSRDYAPGDEPEGFGGQRGPSQSNGRQQPSFQGDMGGGGQQANVDRMSVRDRHGSQSSMDHRTFERVPAVGRRSSPGGGQQQQQRFQPQQPQQPQQRGPGGPPPPPPRPGQNGGGGGFGGGMPQRGGQAGGGHDFGAQQQPQQAQPLYLIFNNNRYLVDTDKFVIGRGSQQTDLTIRDGNISRKHCAVIRRNGQYYIKDLDSTNGIEYQGNRIESKRIEEGDVFYLCDYELRFTFRG